MESQIKVTLTQEAWKYLYGILSRIFFINEEDLQVVNEIFNTIEDPATVYENTETAMQGMAESLKATYRTQQKNGATEVMLKATEEKMEELRKGSLEWAEKKIDLDFPKSHFEFVSKVIRNFMTTKLVDENMRSEGIAGRGDIRLRVEVLGVFNINS